MADGDGRQVERRQGIQAEAWRLMAERGYDGVTMRELSKRTGISTRTLYEIYGGKDALLGEAFRGRLEIVFERIEAAIDGKGVDRLIQMNGAIVDSIARSENFSRAYASVLASNRISIYTIETPVKHFLGCLEQMREAGDFLPWVDLELTARRLLMGQHALMIQWGNGTISIANLEGLYMLAMCEMLIPLTSGDTRDALQARLQTLHRQFTGKATF
ncbi:TetR/AcrR family transcriptional regulator [Emcibacter sp. SYSU 3D8]|uniref:TetR/AcrR family transcriptional regulator n=1 Tax=Emcibacter sp. SYSU 3D8 TaxID=3133969 RepID=UPI0031FE729E